MAPGPLPCQALTPPSSAVIYRPRFARFKHQSWLEKAGRPSSDGSRIRPLHLAAAPAFPVSSPVTGALTSANVFVLGSLEESFESRRLKAAACRRVIPRIGGKSQVKL